MLFWQQFCFCFSSCSFGVSPSSAARSQSVSRFGSLILCIGLIAMCTTLWYKEIQRLETHISLYDFFYLIPFLFSLILACWTLLKKIYIFQKKLVLNVDLIGNVYMIYWQMELGGSRLRVD